MEPKSKWRKNQMLAERESYKYLGVGEADTTIIMLRHQHGCPFSIVHCFRQVFRATSRICTELLYVGSSWSSCLCSSMWRVPQEYVTCVRPYFFSSVLHVWFVELGWFSWWHSCCFVGCCLQDLFNFARRIFNELKWKKKKIRRKQYFRRTIKLLETKLCSKNLIKTINIWTILLIKMNMRGTQTNGSEDK